MKQRIVAILMIGLLLVGGYKVFFAKEEDPQADYIAEAKSLSEQGYYRDSVLMYEKALEEDRKNVDIRRAIAEQYMQAGDYNTAVSRLEELIRETGSREEYINLSLSYYYAGDKQRAVTTIAEGSKKYEMNSEIAALFDELKGEYAKRCYAGGLTADYLDGYAPAKSYKGEINLVNPEGGKRIKLAGDSGIKMEEILDYCSREEDGKEKIFVTAKTEDGIIALDQDGFRRILPEGNYSYVGCLRDGYYLLRDEAGWGYADASCRDLGLRFEEATAFAEGIAAVKEDGLWRIISTETVGGAPAADTRRYEDVAYDRLRLASRSGGVLVKTGAGWQLVSADGTALSAVYDEVKPYVADDGYAAVKKGGVWGLINSAGAEVITPSAEELNSGGSTLIAFRQGDLWGYVSHTGEIYVEPQFAFAGLMNEEGRAYIKKPGEEEGMCIEMYIYHKDEGLSLFGG